MNARDIELVLANEAPHGRAQRVRWTVVSLRCCSDEVCIRIGIEVAPWCERYGRNLCRARLLDRRRCRGKSDVGCFSGWVHGGKDR
jgi:hypothetical protein